MLQVQDFYSNLPFHYESFKAYFRDSKNIFCGNNPSEKNIDSGVHAVFYAYHTPFLDWMFGVKINLEEAKHLYQLIYLLGYAMNIGSNFNDLVKTLDVLFQNSDLFKKE